MNEACIILAEEMTCIWLNPTSPTLRRPCLSLSCCVYRVLKTDPDPQGVSRGVEGSAQWDSDTDLSDRLFLPPLSSFTVPYCSLGLRFTGHLSPFVRPCKALSRLSTSHTSLPPNPWQQMNGLHYCGATGSVEVGDERGGSWWARSTSCAGFDHASIDHDRRSMHLMETSNFRYKISNFTWI